MSYIESFKAQINESNLGLDFPVGRLNDLIPGVQKKRIYTVGAGSGVGKTKFALEFFVFNIFDNYYHKQESDIINIHLFSLEVPKEEVIAALASRWLYKTHNVLVDYGYLLGYWKKFPVDEYVKSLLDSDPFIHYISEFEKCVNILDMSVNTIAINKYIDKIAKDSGVIHTKAITTSDGTTIELFDRYDKNDENEFNIFVFDHIGLIRLISDQNKKKMIDDLAEVEIKARNRYGFTFVNTQQLNRNSNSVERHKLEDLVIKDSDFAEGSGIFHASNVVFGLMSPARERQSSFLGYQVADSAARPGLGSRMVVLNIVKNRHGQAFGVLPMLFSGEVGLYSPLPKDPTQFDYGILRLIVKYYEKVTNSVTLSINGNFQKVNNENIVT